MDAASAPSKARAKRIRHRPTSPGGDGYPNAPSAALIVVTTARLRGRYIRESILITRLGQFR
jgi:hypothetical protein